MSMKYSVLQNEARLFLMVGILGGFTTFSSFGLETFQLLRHDQIMLAGLYAISSLIIGILVLGVGYYMTLDISSASHPFYTGEMRQTSNDGRIASFNKRFGRFKR